MSVQGFPRAFPSPNLLISSKPTGDLGVGWATSQTTPQQSAQKDVWSGLDPGVWLSKCVKCIEMSHHSRNTFHILSYLWHISVLKYMYPVFLRRWLISEYVLTLVPLAGRWTVIVGGAAKLSPNISEGLNWHVCDFGWLEDLFTRLFDGSLPSFDGFLPCETPPGSPAEAKEELKRFQRNSEERQSWAAMRIQNPQDLSGFIRIYRDLSSSSSSSSSWSSSSSSSSWSSYDVALCLHQRPAFGTLTLFLLEIAVFAHPHSTCLLASIPEAAKRLGVLWKNLAERKSISISYV